MFYFASIGVQEVWGYSPIQAGLAFLPFTAGIVIGAGAAQQLMHRLGARGTTLIGLVLDAAGLLLFVRMTADGTYLSELVIPIVIMSIGLGLTFVPVTLMATTGVEAQDAGLASGIFNTSQQVGGSLGLAALSTLANTRTSHLLAGIAHPSTARHGAALIDGFRYAFAAGGGLMVASFILIAVLIRRSHLATMDERPVTVAA
jgi:fucose permease